MTIPHDLAPAAVQIVTLADGVDRAAVRRPTPCPGWPVAVVLDHIIRLTGAFTDGARKKPRRTRPEPSAGPAGAVARGAPEPAGGAGGGVAEPAAWAGEATVGGVTLPAELTAAVVADELVVHGWDWRRPASRTGRIPRWSRPRSPSPSGSPTSRAARSARRSGCRRTPRRSTGCSGTTGRDRTGPPD